MCRGGCGDPVIGRQRLDLLRHGCQHLGRRRAFVDRQQPLHIGVAIRVQPGADVKIRQRREQHRAFYRHQRFLRLHRNRGTIRPQRQTGRCQTGALEYDHLLDQQRVVGKRRLPARQLLGRRLGKAVVDPHVQPDAQSGHGGQPKSPDPQAIDAGQAAGLGAFAAETKEHCQNGRQRAHHHTDHRRSRQSDNDAQEQAQARARENIRQTRRDWVLWLGHEIPPFNRSTICPLDHNFPQKANMPPPPRVGIRSARCDALRR